MVVFVRYPPYVVTGVMEFKDSVVAVVQYLSFGKYLPKYHGKANTTPLRVDILTTMKTLPYPFYNR